MLSIWWKVDSVDMNKISLLIWKNKFANTYLVHSLLNYEEQVSKLFIPNNKNSKSLINVIGSFLGLNKSDGVVACNGNTSQLYS